MHWTVGERRRDLVKSAETLVVEKYRQKPIKFGDVQTIIAC